MDLAGIEDTKIAGVILRMQLLLALFLYEHAQWSVMVTHSRL
jgi:hypothetical protein